MVSAQAWEPQQGRIVAAASAAVSVFHRARRPGATPDISFAVWTRAVTVFVEDNPGEPLRHLTNREVHGRCFATPRMTPV
jgi:hypothetical protein